MSKLTQIILSYARDESTLDDTVRIMLSINILPQDINQNHTEGSWSEIDTLFNTGELSFAKHRQLILAYKKAHHDARFVVLGENYGFVPFDDRIEFDNS